MAATDAPQGGEPSKRFDANASVGEEASRVLLSMAKGDLEAQRFVRDSWTCELRDLKPDAELHDSACLFIARMCAANGDHSDAGVLAMILYAVGDRLHRLGRHALGWERVAESLSLFERLGDEGDAEAVEIVKDMLLELPVEAVARAKEYTLKGKTDGTPAAPACIRAVHRDCGRATRTTRPVTAARRTCPTAWRLARPRWRTRCEGVESMSGLLGLPYGMSFATDMPGVQPAPAASPFVWGQGGARLTPDQIALQQKIAASKMQGDYSPVANVWQGLGRVADNVTGALQWRDAKKASAANTAHDQIIASLLTGSGTGTATGGAGSSPGRSAVAAALADPYLSDSTHQLASKLFDAQNRKPAEPHYWETNTVRSA